MEVKALITHLEESRGVRMGYPSLDGMALLCAKRAANELDSVIKYLTTKPRGTPTGNRT